MSAKDLHKESFTEETITKLEIFEKYLEYWLPVAIKSSSVTEVNVCDFFAGPGKDIDGVKGSPLRIIDVIKKYDAQIIRHRLQIHILFNEYTKEKYNQLCRCVASEREGLKHLERFLEIEIFNEDFKTLFSRVKSLLKNHFNLVFIDQSGVKHVTGDIFSELTQFHRTDFMFFISSSYFKRFASNPNFKVHFPDIDLEKISITKQSEMHRWIIDYYRNKIPNGSKVRLYPFTIKKGANIYGLIFGTKHPLGIDKFLQIVWKENALNGEANFDIDDDLQTKQGLLFEDRKLTKLEKFERELEGHILSKRKISNIELYDFTLESGHIPKHTANVLKNLKEKGRISYSGHPNINYNKCYKDRKRKYFKVIK